jgi:SAM-dependent methyltransferase
MADERLDYDRTKKFLMRAVDDVATAMFGALAYVGDRSGLFRAMADGSPVTADALASRTGLQRRYVLEWLNAMTAAGYVEHEASRSSYRLPREHAAVLADERSPFFVGGFVEMIVPLVAQTPKVLEAFRRGGGVPQSDYPPETFEAMERSSLPWYLHKLVKHWLPLLPGAKARLEAGGRAVDVGCGSGRAAIAIAKAFPTAEVWGFDNHSGSVERAKANAAAEGVGERLRFVADDARGLPASTFDFASTFDVVHDSADPVALLRAIRASLAPGGTYLMLEMNCSPNVNENVNPLGKFLYSVSTLYCMTQSLAEGGAGIGAAMGEPKARELAAAAGFTEFRRLPVDEPFAVLYELRS